MNQNPREVKLKTKIELLKQRPFQALLGFYLVGFTILFAIGGVTVSLSFVDKTVPSVDYEEINEKGKITTGQITNIEIQYKITENGEHPAVISYKYKCDNGEVRSKYQILAPDKVKSMNIGDVVEIKYLGKDSIINGFTSDSFPVWVFAIVPIPFLIVGLYLALGVMSKFKKELNLYRYGKLSKAELVSMTPKPGLMLSKFGQTILVYYKYTTSEGKNILGESLTADFSILNDKRQGDNISILVSEEDESRSCVIPKIEAIRNNWTVD